MTDVRILQITDTHLFTDPSVIKNGMSTSETLSTVLNHALDEWIPDLLLVTGDVAQEPVKETYENFNSILREKYLGDLFVVPGNHDVGAIVEEMYPYCELELGSWSIIGVDTHQDGVVAGHVTEENLRKLEQDLDRTAGHSLVAGHHPITDVGSDWLDVHSVNNGSELVTILEAQENACSYVCGHIHQEFDQMQNGVRYLATPSTCWQFARNSDSFKMDNLAPGWRWLILKEDGSLDTHVSRLSTN